MEGMKMELWQEVIVNKWERLNNPQVMGIEVARKAGEIADFFRSLSYVYYDTFVTKQFSDYVAGMIRGYQVNEQAYDDMHINTTLDLHSVTCTSYGLKYFDSYLSRKWKEYFMFALNQGI